MYVVSGDPNSSPHTCTTSTLNTEPSPQPESEHFFNLPLWLLPSYLLHECAHSTWVRQQNEHWRLVPMREPHDNQQSLVVRTSYPRAWKPVLKGTGLDLKYHGSKGHKEDYLCVAVDWEQRENKVETSRVPYSERLVHCRLYMSSLFLSACQVTIHSHEISTRILDHCPNRQQNQHLEKSPE